MAMGWLKPLVTSNEVAAPGLTGTAGARLAQTRLAQNCMLSAHGTDKRRAMERERKGFAAEYRHQIAEDKAEIAMIEPLGRE